MAERATFVVADDDAGLRLDQVLPKRIAGLSRRKARVAIDLGGVFVDRARVKVASRPVRAGQEIEVHLGGVLARASGDVGAAARAQDDAALPAYAIVFEDDDVIVADKPAGLITAPTPESDRGNLADLLARRPGAGPVHVVHRIDRPTSGLLVFAKTDAANRVLSAAFVAHAVEREYHAVVVGGITAPVAIDRPIGERHAVTHVAPVEALTCDGATEASGRSTGGPGRPPGAARATLVACRLETGRSHQIRIHLAGLGHPVAGDTQHGGAAGRAFTPRPPRLALHARVLGFAHPRTGAPLRFESAWPADLAPWLAALRGEGV
jgi:23S rRNA pseudouridine1911/1915/1917 synthase